MDELGRKGFVTKPGTGGSFCSITAHFHHCFEEAPTLASSFALHCLRNNTARAQAAVALHSKSRYFLSFLANVLLFHKYF